MTNYTKTTDFAAKDALPSGNAAKIVKGSEIDAEFDNIATSSATKANANAAALTGTTTFETISDGTIAITAFVDEDNMASDSATLLPTQQSVKAYVDSQVTAQDLDFQADTGGALSIDLDSETLTLTGGTGIDTSGALNAVTFAIDATVATLAGTQTLSNKTLSAPVVSGNLTTDGLVDGRDVAADGTKLDGIESGATADQTAAEIKTAYESNANTNAFTDTDESKLDGIEALANVTDTANVTAAGALMDSELTDIVAVKDLDQGVATTDSPTFAGLTTTADVSFGDNDKAIFGAGSDLQIYHDGSHSRIVENGTGDLRIYGDSLQLNSWTTAENYLTAATNGAVNIYYDGSTKLATTATGIDVTGTATMDGLQVTNAATTGTNQEVASFRTASGGGLVIRSSDLSSANPDSILEPFFGESLKIKTSGNDRFKIQDNGDISFYEDTGTTPKLFWDASAESLGIGTTSPDEALEVSGDLKISGSNFGIVQFGETSDQTKIVGRDSSHASLPNTMEFFTSSVNRMVIDSSGNVGINTTPKAWTAFAPVLQIKNASTGGGGALAGTSADNFRMFANTYYDGSYKRLATGFATQYGQESGNHVWSYAASGAADSTFTWSEAMRIDSSGNLLVGTTLSSPTTGSGFAVQSIGRIFSSVDGGYVASLNRDTSDGEILRFRKDGTTVGSIGVALSDNLYLSGVDAGLGCGTAAIYPATTTGQPSDNDTDLGTASTRWDDVYATNGTIQTSDRNEKQDIEALSDAEQRVAVAAKGLLRKFRWISSVEENGDDARIHFGIIAQDLQDAFTAEGLDAGRYAMFISSTWTDDDGNEQTRLGVRYSELLAFIISAI